MSAHQAENPTINSVNLAFDKIPQQSEFFLKFLADDANINRFYPEKNTVAKNYAAKVLENFTIDRNRLCAALCETNLAFGASDATLKNIEALREKDCLTVVTGQQAGLFSGALYTIYKIISAIKFAEKLNAENIKAVPVFWIAEEDHDFAEVSKTFVMDKAGKLTEIENTPVGYRENVPVGLIEFDDSINQTIDEIFEILPHTEFSSETKKLLSAAYQSGETYSTAFAKFLTELFGKYGLIILAPMRDSIKKLCAPIFAAAVEKSAEITEKLLQRGAEIERAGFAPQVLVAEDSFPFFYQNENGQRQSLRRDVKTGKIINRQAKSEFTIQGLAEIARQTPQQLSPNALLRPVVQDFLLPTLRYFGGAAEIAYFAQNAVIYETLERPVTPIQHRTSATVIRRKYTRTLEKYDLHWIDLFAGREKIEAGIVEKFLAAETSRTFDETETIINRQLDLLGKSLASNTPTLAANLQNRRKKILWHIAALRKKYHRAAMLENKTINRRLEQLFTALLPHDALQERTLNVVLFLDLYGENFIDWIYNSSEINGKNHQLIGL